MKAFICLFVALVTTPQGSALQGPQFNEPSSAAKGIVSSPAAMAPRLDPPKGYKPVQVPDYVADTYMRFASTETAHDLQINDIDRRLGILEADREKLDRVDIDSLKETRTKALIYLAIGSTLFAVVWGALATLFGYFLKSSIYPRLRVVWDALGRRADYASYPMSQAVAVNASEDEDQGSDS
jgi:hypothetical protein